MIPKPVVLCILDGWGLRSEPEGNAVALADTPNFDRMMQNYPSSRYFQVSNFIFCPAIKMNMFIVSMFYFE